MRCAFSLLLLASLAATLHAADFRIDLRAQSGKATVAAAPVPQPRAVLMAATNTPITVRWTLQNLDQEAAKDVLVHFFVVKQERPNQPELPKLTKNVVAESALTMDFRPKDQTQGELTFTVVQAGCYLIRVEVKGQGGVSVPFAALDLVIR